MIKIATHEIGSLFFFVLYIHLFKFFAPKIYGVETNMNINMNKKNDMHFLI